MSGYCSDRDGDGEEELSEEIREQVGGAGPTPPDSTGEEIFCPFRVVSGCISKFNIYSSQHMFSELVRAG